MSMNSIIIHLLYYQYFYNLVKFISSTLKLQYLSLRHPAITSFKSGRLFICTKIIVIIFMSNIYVLFVLLIFIFISSFLVLKVLICNFNLLVLVIQVMMDPDPVKRPSARELVENPIFCKKTQRIA